MHRDQDFSREVSHSSPRVTSMRVIPVAGHDSMLLNLSGRPRAILHPQLVVLSDDAGHTGAGEVPGGEKIRQVLEEAGSLVLAARSASYHEHSRRSAPALRATAMRAGVVFRPSTCAPRSTRSPRSSARCSTCSASGSACRSPTCWGRDGSGRVYRCSATCFLSATGGRLAYLMRATQMPATSGCACAMKRRLPPTRCAPG